MKPRYPGWRYGPNGEAEIFQTADAVPEGWFDTPQKAVEHAAQKAKKAPEPDFVAEAQPIEIVEAKKANNSAKELSASPKRGRPRKK